MKKNIFWILAFLMGNWCSSVQAQTGLSSDQSRSFAKCLTIGECWLPGQHPNFFELDRFAPALKQFLTPSDYQSLVSDKDVMLALFSKDSRVDVAVGFCSPHPNNPDFSLWDCDNTLVISFSWDGSLKDILDAYNKNAGGDSPFEAVSKGILGTDGQGGKLQILYVSSHTEATYWQDGMAEKTPVKKDSSIFKTVKEACKKAPTEGPAECMQGLANAFSLSK